MFPVFDAHCDTASVLLDSRGELFENSFQLDLKRIKALNAPFVQVFAAFVTKDNANKRAKDIINYYHHLMKNTEGIMHCTSVHEIKAALSKGDAAALLSIEGGDAIEKDIRNLKTFYDMGVRILTLSWNFGNEICSGNGDREDYGITDFGKEVIKKMNSLRMLADASHISDKSFWDLCEISDMPFIVSHSNSRALCPHGRNLTDEQIKAVIKKGGCIGLNFYPVFLAEGRKSGIKDIIRHAEHILALGGENSLGFGSDFDGVDSLPEDISGVESYSCIAEEFLRRGYSEDILRKIFFDNFLRVMKKVLD